MTQGINKNTETKGLLSRTLTAGQNKRPAGQELSVVYKGNAIEFCTLNVTYKRKDAPVDNLRGKKNMRL
eukprot:1161106-Pelagomonas_calceolata.AAC.8